MTDSKQHYRLHQQLAQTLVRRDAIKQAIEQGRVHPRRGFRELDMLETLLSELREQLNRGWRSRRHPRYL